MHFYFIIHSLYTQLSYQLLHLTGTWKVCPLYCIVHSPYKQLTNQPSHSLTPSMGLLRHAPIMINKHNQIFNSCMKSLHTFSARPPKCQCWINFVFNLNQSIKHHWTTCVQVHLILLHSWLITRFIWVLCKSHTYSIIWLVMTQHLWDTWNNITLHQHTAVFTIVIKYNTAWENIDILHNTIYYDIWQYIAMFIALML